MTSTNYATIVNVETEVKAVESVAVKSQPILFYYTHALSTTLHLGIFEHVGSMAVLRQ